MDHSTRRAVLAAIDQANEGCPQRVTDGEGREVSKERLYSERMTRWLSVLEPSASPELQIAVRAQHIRRWESQRCSYPKGRTGYKQWRSQLQVFHAQCARDILEREGVCEASILRVENLLQKKERTRDPESQTLEDVACLVFLEHEFEAFAAKHDFHKLVQIVKKTWKKMSERGRKAALGLTFSESSKSVIAAALGGE